MTTVEKLLAQKQQMVGRLQEDPGPEERNEIEGQLGKIDIALGLLEEMAPGTSGDEVKGPPA
jgi:hypothetical protein